MVVGGVLIVIVAAVVLPALFWAGAFLLSWALSALLPHHAEATHEGSELIATNI